MIRAAIVGCGDVSIVHREAINAIEDAELVALVDSDPAQAELARQWGVPVYDNHLEMLEAAQPDVVHITTPHHQHAPVAVDLINAGANIILEKPLAHSREHADAILEASKNAAGKIGVCFQNRYNRSSQKLKKLIDSGAIGTIEGAWANVVWTRTAQYYADRPWRALWNEAGGGVLINQSIHTLDLVQWLLGEVVEVRGAAGRTKFRDIIEVEDTATAWMKHESGAETSFFATLNSSVMRPVEIEVWGSEGTARIAEGLTVNIFAGGASTEIPERIAPTTGRSYWGYSHELLIRDFYDQLDSPSPFWISPIEANKSLEIIADIYRGSGPDERPLTGPRT